MAFTKRSVIIIPGLGDRAKLYRLVAPVWKLLGYEPYIFSFGWEDVSESFEAASKRLTDYLDDLHATRVDIIGVSAGGTAAINALAVRPQTVQRVVTVATPYEYLSGLKNEKLRASINKIVRDGIDRSKVLSVHGLYDQTVPVEASRLKDLHTRKIYAIGHGCIIFASLTLYSLTIRRFLRMTR